MWLDRVVVGVRRRGKTPAWPCAPRSSTGQCPFQNARPHFRGPMTIPQRRRSNLLQRVGRPVVPKDIRPPWPVRTCAIWGDWGLASGLRISQTREGPNPGFLWPDWKGCVAARLLLLAHPSRIAHLETAGATDHVHRPIDLFISQGVHSRPRCNHRLEPRTATAGGGAQAVGQTPETPAPRPCLFGMALGRPNDTHPARPEEEPAKAT